MEKLELNKIVVIKPTDKLLNEFNEFEDEKIVFVDKDFPLNQFNDLIEGGFYTFREATVEEKNFAILYLKSIIKPLFR
jgi:hypothetical protein